MQFLPKEQPKINVENQISRSWDSRKVRPEDMSVQVFPE